MYIRNTPTDPHVTCSRAQSTQPLRLLTTWTNNSKWHLDFPCLSDRPVRLFMLQKTSGDMFTHQEEPEPREQRNVCGQPGDTAPWDTCPPPGPAPSSQRCPPSCLCLCVTVSLCLSVGGLSLSVSVCVLGLLLLLLLLPLLCGVVICTSCSIATCWTWTASLWRLYKVHHTALERLTKASPKSLFLWQVRQFLYINDTESYRCY